MLGTAVIVITIALGMIVFRISQTARLATAWVQVEGLGIRSLRVFCCACMVVTCSSVDMILSKPTSYLTAVSLVS